MIFVKGRCPYCGADLFWDQQDGTVSCLLCARYSDRGPTRIVWKIPDGHGSAVKRILKPNPVHQDSQDRKNNSRR